MFTIHTTNWKWRQQKTKLLFLLVGTSETTPKMSAASIARPLSVRRVVVWHILVFTSDCWRRCHGLFYALMVYLLESTSLPQRKWNVALFHVFYDSRYATCVSGLFLNFSLVYDLLFRGGTSLKMIYVLTIYPMILLLVHWRFCDVLFHFICIILVFEV